MNRVSDRGSRGVHTKKAYYGWWGLWSRAMGQPQVVTAVPYDTDGDAPHSLLIRPPQLCG